jgi:hypothetical protein
MKPLIINEGDCRTQALRGRTEEVSGVIRWWPVLPRPPPSSSTHKWRTTAPTTTLTAALRFRYAKHHLRNLKASPRTHFPMEDE